MAVVRWEPFRELAALQDRVNRVFNDVYGGQGHESLMSRGAWAPPVDIYENEKQELVIKAELPEIRREDIDLRIENNMLTLSGERKLDPNVKEEQFHRTERSYGTFTRSFSLPQFVDTSAVRADYRDGVLTITLPKREESRPKQIQVQVGS